MTTIVSRRSCFEITISKLYYFLCAKVPLSGLAHRCANASIRAHAQVDGQERLGTRPSNTATATEEEDRNAIHCIPMTPLLLGLLVCFAQIPFSHSFIHSFFHGMRPTNKEIIHLMFNSSMALLRELTNGPMDN